MLAVGIFSTSFTMSVTRSSLHITGFSKSFQLVKLVESYFIFFNTSAKAFACRSLSVFLSVNKNGQILMGFLAECLLWDKEKIIRSGIFSGIF